MIGDRSGSSDAQVIGRSLVEPEAFGVVFERHFPLVCRYLRRRLGAAIADELASETFAVAFDRRIHYDLSRQDARPWLFGIATNLLRHHLRTERRQLSAFARTGVDPVTDPSAERTLASVEDRADVAEKARLAGALAGLSDGDRDVVLLRAWGGLTYSQIAEALGIPIGTVRSRLSHARRCLRDVLSPSGQETSDRASAQRT